MMRPNPSLNADVPHAGLRRRSGPPVSLFRWAPTIPNACRHRKCRMKTITIALIALGCSHVAYAQYNRVDVIDKVAVRIESDLYEKENHPNYFIHVELRNQTPHEIGVDLSDKWMVFYPNQWGGSDLDYRTVIDERAIVPKRLDTRSRTRLIEAFKSKQLTVLPPSKSVDYFTNFNASGRKDIQAAKGKFILISIKGQLWFTDGSEVWDEQPGRDLAIEKPVTWKTIPGNAIVIER